jgi:outer membrane protein insertion porin family
MMRSQVAGVLSQLLANCPMRRPCVLPRIGPIWQHRYDTLATLAFTFRLLIVVIVWSDAIGARPVHAAELQAKSSRPREIEVTGIELEGNKAFSSKQIKAVLATKESSWLPWGEKHYYIKEDFEDDLRRIRAFYVDQGYPRARVVSHELRFNDRKDKVAITIRIEEGPPVVIESVQFFGFDELPETSRNFLRRTLAIQPGRVRRQDDIVAARDRYVLVLNERGYPYARVQALEGQGSKPNTVTITLAAEPGRQAKIGSLEIVGNTSVGEDIIRRYLAIGPGDQFRRSRLAESQRRLYNLELFQYVAFDVPNLASQPEEVPLRMIVTEGKHRRMQLGVGYGTEDKARVTANWRHVNFFGGARTLGFEGKYSSLDRGIRVNFTEPYFFSPSYKLTLSAQNWYADEPAFTLLTTGGRATVSREIVRRDPLRRRFSTTRAALTFVNEYEHQKISEEALNDPTFRDELIALGLDPRTGDQAGTVVAFAFDISHDTTRNILDARNGYVVSLHLEQAGSWLPGDFSYQETVFEGRHYLPIGPQMVLANRLRLGSITSPGSEEVNVPFFKRYFLGGSTSLRGWSRYQVGPLTDAGLPIGGFTLLEGSTELRFPIKGNLTGVAFLDYGNVWDMAWDFNLDDMVYAVGPGLRYRTPIGPVRLDFGYQLKRVEGLVIDGEPEKHRWRLHFSVGQAF